MHDIGVQSQLLRTFNLQEKIWKTEQKLLHQFFNGFNFALMICGQFPPRNGLKLEFVLFEAERDNDAEGISAPGRAVTFSASKRTNSIFRPLLSGN